jgi:hypothetical protein
MNNEVKYNKKLDIQFFEGYGYGGGNHRPAASH